MICYWIDEYHQVYNKIDIFHYLKSWNLGYRKISLSTHAAKKFSPLVRISVARDLH